MSEDAAQLAAALQLVARKDREAFHRLYDLTANRIFRICRRICVDRATAEDVLQDVYATVWDKADHYDPSRGSAIAWLSTIARNRAIDCHRANETYSAVNSSILTDFVDPSPTAEAIALTSERSRLVRQSMNALEAKTRDAMLRSFFDGLTYGEVAERSGVPLTTIKSRIRRGLLRMRKQLDDSELPCQPILLAVANS